MTPNTPKKDETTENGHAAAPSEEAKGAAKPGTLSRGGVKAAGTVSGGGGGGGASEHIFLSPRVLDQAAFSEFSSTLRALIEQASALVTGLRGATEGAQRTLASVVHADETQRAGVDLLNRALGSVEQRSQRVQRLVEEAEAAAARLGNLETTADEWVESKAAALESRLDAAVAAATTRAAAIEQRLATLGAELDEKTTDLRTQIQTSAGPAILQLQTLLTRADAHVQGDASEKTHKQEAHGHVPGPQKTQQTSGGLAALVAGSVAQGNDASGSTMRQGLSTLLTRAEKLRDEASFSVRQLDAVKQQADQARSILGEALTGATELIDQAAARQEELQASLRDAVKHCRVVSQTLDERVTELREAAEQAVAEAQPRAEQSAAALRRTIDDAEETGETVRRLAAGVVASAEEAGAKLRELLKAVEPWRGVLLGEAGGEHGELPMALKAVVEQFHAGLAGDLASVAESLRAIAGKVETNGFGAGNVHDAHAPAEKPAHKPKVQVTPAGLSPAALASVTKKAESARSQSAAAKLEELEKSLK